MGVTTDLDLANAREGVYTYRIQGAVVHEVGPLRAREGEKPLIYFHDPNEQVARWQEIFLDVLEEGHLRDIQAALETSNRFCQAYKNIREREAEHGPIEDVKIVLKATRETDGRRQWQYDLPSANEVADLHVWCHRLVVCIFRACLVSISSVVPAIFA